MTSTHPTAMTWRERYASDPEFREAESRRKREAKVRLRREAIDTYGGACTCCGEANFAFLLLDHINDDGAEHRRGLRPEFGARVVPGGNGAGGVTYIWLKKHGWPDGVVQVHCSNCNYAKQMVGVCPHQETR